MGISNFLKGLSDGLAGAEKSEPHSYSDKYVWTMDVDKIRNMEKDDAEYSKGYEQGSDSRERGSHE